MIQVIGITKKQASEILGRLGRVSHRELRTMLGRKGEAGLGQSPMTIEEANEATRHICSPKTGGEERLYELERTMEERREAAYSQIPGWSGMSSDERVKASMQISDRLAEEERELYDMDLDTVIDTLSDIEAQRTSPRAQAFFDAQLDRSWDSVKAFTMLHVHVQYLKSNEESDYSEEEVVEAISKLDMPVEVIIEAEMETIAKKLRLLLALIELSPQGSVREAAEEKISEWSERIADRPS